MATFITNTDLSTQFINNTRVWAGAASQTAFVSNDPIEINDNVTVSGTDCHVVTTRLGSHNNSGTVNTGTISLINSALDMSSASGANTAGGNNGLSCTSTATCLLYTSPSPRD